MAEARCKVPPTFEVVSEHPRQSAPGAATSRYRPDPWYGFGTVGRICIVCRHADRRTVDAAIASGTPYRRIAAQYGLKAAAVGRHAKAHLPQKRPPAVRCWSGCLTWSAGQRQRSMLQFCSLSRMLGRAPVSNCWPALPARFRLPVFAPRWSLVLVAADSGARRCVP